MRRVFIAGTDTNVGKTWVTGKLAAYLKQVKNKAVVTQKWVQTGASEGVDDISEHWRLMGSHGLEFEPYKKALVPYSFSMPASPHLASENENKIIDPNRILTALTALQNQFEWVLVEGSGGIMVPYNRKGTLCDILEKIKIPVILVAENRLGAINQSLLNLEVLRVKRIPIVGIYLNNIQQESVISRDNADIIKELGNVAVFTEIKDLAEFLLKMS